MFIFWNLLHSRTVLVIPTALNCVEMVPTSPIEPKTLPLESQYNSYYNPLSACTVQYHSSLTYAQHCHTVYGPAMA